MARPDFSSFSDEQLTFLFDCVEMATPNLPHFAAGGSILYSWGSPDRTLWENDDEAQVTRALLAELDRRGIGDPDERAALANRLAEDTTIEVHAFQTKKPDRLPVLRPEGT